MTDETLKARPTFSPGNFWPEARALEPSGVFWFAMFAASALGTNLGDFCAGSLGLGLPAAFASLAAVTAVLIAGDRRFGRAGEIGFWLAIVFLRAMATNVGDALTHFGVSRLVSTPLLGAATLAAGGYFTVAGGRANASPRIDMRYWFAMFIAGAFGTVAGDLAAHDFGLAVASLALSALLVIVIGVRSWAAPASMLGYWCIVLAERAAGTPVGDGLAEKRGLGYGLPVAMTITGAALLLALAFRARMTSSRQT